MNTERKLDSGLIPIKGDLELKPLDVVAYVGRKKDIAHKLTRMLHSFKDRDKQEMPIHSGIVIPDADGKLMVAEMKFGTLKGLSLNPVNIDQDYIKGVTRFKLTDKEKANITKSIHNDFKKGVDYAHYSGFMNFLFKNKEKKDLKSAICSEYVSRKIEEGSNYDIVKKWHKVMPVDLINMDQIKLHKKGTKTREGASVTFIKRKDLVKQAFQKLAMLF